MNKIEEIRSKLAKRTHKETIKDEEKLRELGLDSLDVVDLLMQLEDEYGIQFDDVDMAKLITVKDLLSEIEAKLK